MATILESTPLAPRVRWEDAYLTRLLVTDVVVVLLAVFLAQYLRFGLSPSLDGSAETQRMTGFSLLFAALWLTALALFRTRARRVIGGGIDEYRQVVAASMWTFGAIAIVTLLLRVDVARGYLAVALPFGTLALLLARHRWRARLQRERGRGELQTTVLAIGNLRAVTVLAHQLTVRPTDGYRIVGFGVPGYSAASGEVVEVNGEAIPILGDELQALEAMGSLGVDTVAITDTQHFGVAGLRELTWRLEAADVDLVVSPGMTDVAGTRLAMRPVAGFPLIHVEKPQYEGAKRFQKRAFDFVFALAALVVASPVLLLAAIAIKLNSRGPVFYCAERIGLDGRPFKMLKLRTMVVDADQVLHDLLPANESKGGVLFKMRQDPRVTKVGRILRRFSIDELPQFINVLRQDMSVVGPRPPLQREVETYDGPVMRRLLVRPGITGLWQVSGRSDLSWDETVRLDLSYVENWSMLADLLIILKTLRAVLASEGAY